jgi:ribosomal protein L20
VRRIRLQEAEQYTESLSMRQDRTSTGLVYEYRTRKDLKKADTELLWTDRIPQAK